MFINNLTSQLNVIEVKGADSKKFLQGQLTNDINQLDEKNFQFSAHLNNKGRMLASFIITKPELGCYYLITASEIIDKIIPRLKMFVLRSQVQINRLEANVLFGNHTLPNGINIHLNSNYILSITHNVDGTIKSNPDEWKNFLINQGIPLIYANTHELFTPQQVNYDLFDGVNFKKGCYTGQEIVARTHYLGKVKRRMYQFISDARPEIGQIVVSPKLDNQEVGVIVEVLTRSYNYLGLVSLQSDCINDAFLDIANTQQLLVQEIEYSHG